jgi:FtsP/CotA-like multicopper oxidase with cupredoxin domain
VQSASDAPECAPIALQKADADCPHPARGRPESGFQPRWASRSHDVILTGAMAPYAWSLNGEYWPNVNPLMIAAGQRVAIELVNHSMMAHPLHLHGHAFQVIGLKEPHPVGKLLSAG